MRASFYSLFFYIFRGQGMRVTLLSMGDNGVPQAGWAQVWSLRLALWTMRIINDPSRSGLAAFLSPASSLVVTSFLLEPRETRLLTKSETTQGDPRSLIEERNITAHMTGMPHWSISCVSPACQEPCPGVWGARGGGQTGTPLLPRPALSLGSTPSSL